MKSKLILLSLLTVLFSCADDTAFQGNSSRQRSMDNDNTTPGFENESDAYAEQSDWESSLDADSGQQKLKLKLKPSPQPTVDYLFIVDNSVSMGNKKENYSSGMMADLQRGFVDIAENGEFPDNAKIGVISTAVLGVSEADVATKAGFKALVNKSSIKSSKRTSKSVYPGCENGWFSPKDQDAKDKYCLVSATMFRLAETGFEAGISSFDNFLDAQKGSQPFRRGALLNVIFFSDTHDIGKTNDGNTAQTLIQRRDAYTYEDLAAKVKNISNVQSVKFHAVAPVRGQGNCGNEKEHGTYAYSKLVKASNGKEAHCSGLDYAAFISDMVSNSKQSNKILSIPETLTKAKIARVLVEGKEVEFLVNDAKHLIMLKDVNVSGNKELDVEIVVK